tara:strand:- start:302 stop:460 length:159 start_codon:yes stop_codon:yes gene_type:complete
MEYSERKRKFQKRRLNLLILIRDGLERRLAGLNASIDTLNQQIERDSITNES